jgi:hypothetical protein
MFSIGIVWILAALIVIISISVVLARNARATTSIATVLYNVENPERAAHDRSAWARSRRAGGR